MNILRRWIERRGFVPREKFDAAMRAKAHYQRAYEAASTGRLFADWTTSTRSADADIAPAFRTMLARARDGEINNDHYERFLKLLENNVLGSNGILLQMKIREPDGKGGTRYDKVACDKIEAAWKKWARKEFCTASKEDTWRTAQILALRSVARDGQLLIRLRRGFDNAFGFAIELLEIDHLDIDYNTVLPNGNRVVMGIEKNRLGQRVAYYLWKDHPGDILTGAGSRGYWKRERVPAAEIIHAFVKKRVSQNLGMTWFAPSMTKMKMLDGYAEAELVAARTAACKGGFFYSENGEQYEGDAEAEDGSIIASIEPGQMEQLPKGVKFQPYDPKHPNAAFEIFVKACLRSIAGGLGVSYVSLANDLEGVNYSSIRSGLLEEREEWMKIQGWFIENVVSPIFEAWMPMAILSGQIQLPMSKLDKFMAAEWKARRWGWVDPLKDITAKIMAIRNNLTSHRSTISEAGGDVEDVFEDRQQDQQLAKQHGLILDPDSEESLREAAKMAEDEEPQPAPKKKPRVVIPEDPEG